MQRRTLVQVVGLAIMVLLTFTITYLVRSAAPDTYSHVVTLSAQNDGRLGAFANRNQAIAALTTEHNDVRVEPRFSSLIDVTSSSPSQREATARADQVSQIMLDERLTNTQERFRSTIVVNRSQLEALANEIAQLILDVQAEPEQIDAQILQRELNGLIDTSVALRRQVVFAEADLASVVIPLAVLSSTPEGKTGPSPLRDAAIGALATWITITVALSLLPASQHR